MGFVSHSNHSYLHIFFFVSKKFRENGYSSIQLNQIEWKYVQVKKVFNFRIQKYKRLIWRNFFPTYIFIWAMIWSIWFDDFFFVRFIKILHNKNLDLTKFFRETEIETSQLTSQFNYIRMVRKNQRFTTLPRNFFSSDQLCKKLIWRN